MVYNLTGIGTNTTSLVTLVQGVNENLMQGWLGILFIIGIATIAFIAFQTNTGDVKRSFTVSTFIAFSISIMFMAVGLINALTLYISLAMVAIALALSYRSNR